VRARKQRFADRVHPRFEIARTGDHERPRALRGQHRVDQEERHAAKVIAVQVREDDRVDGVGVDPLLGERDERRRTEVDGDARGGPVDEDTCLKSAAAPEGVTRADEADTHGHRA
jgi:hypothetical protein